MTRPPPSETTFRELYAATYDDVLRFVQRRTDRSRADEPQCFLPGLQREEDSRWDQVVLKVTPLEAGTVVVVDGIDLTYSTQFQRGTEHTGSTGVIVLPNE